MGGARVAPPITVCEHMNDTELQALLSQQSAFDRRVHEALRQHGKLTDRQLRDMLGSPGSGPHDALKKMLPLGLVRHAGKAKAKGNPMQWEATPAAEIEGARERYATLKPKKKPRRNSPTQRLAELRKLERGDVREWHPTRDKILAALPVLTNAVKMAFWETVPPDELHLALDEIEELRDAAEEALAAGRERLQHEKTKAKIGKMENRNGRTDAENEVFSRKAERLREKLLPTD